MEMLLNDSTSVYKKISFVVMNMQACVGFIGIMGSILSICVFSRKPLKNSSYSMYFRVMAIIDCIVLIHVYRHWARVMLGFDIDLYSPLLCKLNEYQPFVAAHIQLWLYTIILADRLVIVVYHYKFTFVKKRWFQQLVIAIVFVYCLLTHLIMPFNYELQFKKIPLTNESYKIVKVCHLPLKILNINNLLFLSNTIATACVNILLYVKLILFIFKSRRKILFCNNLARVRDLKFAISSVVYTFVAFIFKAPIAIGLTLSHYFRLEPDQFEMVFMICVLFAVIVNGATFYVNFFFNSIFQEEFFNIFRRPQQQH